MAETATAEPQQAEAPPSISIPTGQRAEHPQSPAGVLRRAEAQRETNPVDRSSGERRNNMRERLKKWGVSLAIIAAIGALIIGTHGLGIVPLKGWLAAHHLTGFHFTQAGVENAVKGTGGMAKTVAHDVGKDITAIGTKLT